MHLDIYGNLTTGFEAIRYSQFDSNTSNNTTQLCGMLWLKSFHEGFMPWASVPCSLSLDIRHILCEYNEAGHTRDTEDGGHLKSGSSTTLQITSHPCPQFWVLIINHCYQVSSEPLGSNQPRSQNYSYWTSGLNTALSSSEQERAEVYRFLEYYVRIKNIWRLQVKLGKYCSYLEYTKIGHRSSWQMITDCNAFHKIFHYLCKGYTRSLVFGRNHKYKNMPYKYRIVLHEEKNSYICSSQPRSDVYMSINDRNNLLLSSYLARLPSTLRHSGVAVHINTSHCQASFPMKTGDPPTWYSNQDIIDCIIWPNIVYKDYPQSAVPPYGCHSNHFQCTDGTCILSQHQCDGTIDCHDGSDEQECPAICVIETPKSTAACLVNCQLPSCLCSALYYQCPEGKCIHIESVCNGIKTCDDGSDEKHGYNDFCQVVFNDCLIGCSIK